MKSAGWTRSAPLHVSRTETSPRGFSVLTVLAFSTHGGTALRAEDSTLSSECHGGTPHAPTRRNHGEQAVWYRLNSPQQLTPHGHHAISALNSLLLPRPDRTFISPHQHIMLRARYPFLAPSTHVDHLVIGGGVVGLAVAAGLVNTAGKRTTFVVERRALVSRPLPRRSALIRR